MFIPPNAICRLIFARLLLFSFRISVNSMYCKLQMFFSLTAVGTRLVSIRVIIHYFDLEDGIEFLCAYVCVYVHVHVYGCVMIRFKKPHSLPFLSFFPFKMVQSKNHHRDLSQAMTFCFCSYRLPSNMYAFVV